jgi:hypothetical protein
MSTTLTFYPSKEQSLFQSGGVGYGTSKEVHAPIGRRPSDGSKYRELIKFTLDFGSLTSITSAYLRIKTTGGIHLEHTGGSFNWKVGRLTKVFSASGGAAHDGTDAAWTVGANSNWDDFTTSDWTNVQTASISAPADTTVYDLDITPIVEDWFSGSTNYGLVLYVVDETSGSNDYAEFFSMRGAYEPRLIVTGSVTPTPIAPVVIYPTDGTIFEARPTTIEFEWQQDYLPVDEKTGIFGYDLKVGTTYGGSDLLNAVGSTSGLSTTGTGDYNNVTYTYAGSTIPLGYTIYVQARGHNSDGGYGPWTEWTFLVKNPPNAPTLTSPSSTKPYAVIHNLNDLAAWTGTGGEAKPRVTLYYEHPDGYSAQAFEFKFDSTTVSVTRSVASLSTVDFDISLALARNTNISFQCRVQAEGGQWSSWTTSFNMKLQWAQGLYDYAHGAGAGDFLFTNSGVTGGAWVQSAFAFRKSNGTPGAWKATPGEVTAGTNMQVLVRLATAHGSQNPSLADMTLTYSTAGNPVPDHWAVTGGSLSLDSSMRRFGARSMRVVTSSTNCTVKGQPGSTTTAPIEVTPGEDYTASVYVHTLGATLSVPLVLAVYDASGNVIEGHGPLDNVPSHTSDHPSSAYTSSTNGDWQRLSVTVTIPSGVTRVWFKVDFLGCTSGEEFRMDSAQFEEFGRPTLWRPGAIGAGVTLDVGGVMVNAAQDAYFRLQGTNNTSSSVVDLSTMGLRQPVATFVETTAPGTPASGEQYLYTKSSDGKMYRKNSAGTETEVGSLSSIAGAWPIGSVFISVVSTNPATLLGFGTWSAFGAGRVLVGINGSDTDFDVVEETGGSKTHIHTGPSHTHSISSHYHVLPFAGTSNTAMRRVGTADFGQTAGTHSTVSNITATSATNTNQTLMNSDVSSAANTGSDGTGNTGSTSNMPPYIVVYMWKRTA